LRRRLLAAILCGAWADAAAQAPAAGVQISTAAPTIESVYRVGKMRDPFIKIIAASSAAGVCKDAEVAEFNIHLLNVRAMMRDPEADYALLVDPCGVTYIFRKGRLYDTKDKRVPGISGTMNIEQKTLSLQNEEKDVQVYRLGEVEEDKE
jgi:hypothetical protein